LLLGGDIRPAALEAAAANIGRKHKPRALLRWDACDLPLRDQSIDRVVTNPPFGRQLGTPRENASLYAGLLAELDRVLRPSGRIVLISSMADLVRQSIRRLPRLHIVRGHPLKILGLRATIYIIERPG
jgi:tRNA G10  N-methylase Trm11